MDQVTHQRAKDGNEHHFTAQKLMVTTEGALTSVCSVDGADKTLLGIIPLAPGDRLLIKHDLPLRT